jgi:hypothetical protein
MVNFDVCTGNKVSFFFYVVCIGLVCFDFWFAESSMERDKFMSPVDAKEFGIIDKILDHPPKHGEKTESSEHCNVACN